MKKLLQNRPALRSAVKAVTVVVLLLLLLIPLGMVKSVVFEREGRFREAAADIVHGAGGSPQLFGPLVEYPYLTTITIKDEEGESREVKRRGFVYVLPKEIRINGNLAVEYRHRGIYRVPVFDARLRMEGLFESPERIPYPENATPLVDEIRLTMGISDMRGIDEITPLLWGTEEAEFKPAAVTYPHGPGIAVSLPYAASGESTPFSWDMRLGGGGSIAIQPTARNAALELSGDWPSPSFKGAVLPDDRQVDDNGFRAAWRIPEVSRPLPPLWRSGEAGEPDWNDGMLVVELLETVGAYARIERSVKHGALFLLIPFAVFFLFETLSRRRIHPVQYLLAGAADVVFYLLLLSLSEHLGFDPAYGIAAGATTVLISLYAGVVLGRGPARWVMPVVLAGSWTWLWVTLKSEDYALLLGSVGLFVILGAVMMLTRKVDWYGMGPDETRS